MSQDSSLTSQDPSRKTLEEHSGSGCLCPSGLGRLAGPPSACSKNGLQVGRKIFPQSGVTIVTSSWQDGRRSGETSGVVVG